MSEERNMNFQELYESKRMTAEELAKTVESGWVFGIDTGASQPDGIMKAVCERAAEGGLRGIRIHTMMDVYPFAFYANNTLDGKVNGLSWFSSAGARKAVAGGYATYMPNYYRDDPKLIRENISLMLFVYLSLRWTNTDTSALPRPAPIPKP